MTASFTPQTRWVTPMGGKADQPKPTASTPFPALAKTFEKEFDKAAKRDKPAKAPQTGKAVYQPIDPATLTICNDPVLSTKPVVGTKYGDILAALKVGQAIKCPPNAVGHLCGAMRKHIKTMGLTHIVRSTKDYGDGLGRVWMLAAPTTTSAAKAVQK